MNVCVQRPWDFLHKQRGLCKAPAGFTRELCYGALQSLYWLCYRDFTTGLHRICEASRCSMWAFTLKLPYRALLQGLTKPSQLCYEASLQSFAKPFGASMLWLCCRTSLQSFANPLLVLQWWLHYEALLQRFPPGICKASRGFTMGLCKSSGGFAMGLYYRDSQTSSALI